MAFYNFLRKQVPKLAETLMSKYDTNKDGKLDMVEFKLLYANVKQVYAEVWGMRADVNVTV